MITSDEQLEDKAEQLRVNLVGIYNKDELPKHTQHGGYIFNLQDRTNSAGDINSGTHWVACWIEKKDAIYFDSFALGVPANIQLFLKKFDITRNEYQLQNENSGWCGYYALAFLFYMSHYKGSVKERFDRFLLLWSKFPEENLSRLKAIFRHFTKL